MRTRLSALQLQGVLFSWNCESNETLLPLKGIVSDNLTGNLLFAGGVLLLDVYR
jgi:hypothetical protein